MGGRVRARRGLELELRATPRSWLAAGSGLIGSTIAAIMPRPFPLSVLGSIKRALCVS